MNSADIPPARKRTQRVLPIASQARSIAVSNSNLLNCWLGIATKESLGTYFCVGCENLKSCNNIYNLFAGSRRMHPAGLARKILTTFDIASDYLDGE